MEIIKYITDDVIRNFSKEVSNLLSSLGIGSDSDTVDMNSIVEKLGLKISFDKTLNVHAKINGDTITLNANDDESQQRFSMAHEIGHIILKDYLNVNISNNKTGLNINYNYKDRDLLDVAREIGKTKKIEEHNDEPVLANDMYEEAVDYFAAQFLVPANKLCVHISEDNDKLASRFGVKPSCIAKRKIELPYELKVFSPAEYVPCENDSPVTKNELEDMLSSW